MPQIESRVSLILSSGHETLKMSVCKLKMKILKKSTEPPRGKYKPRERYNNNMKVVTSAAEVLIFEDDRYARLTKGTLILEKWLDIHERFAGKKAPEEWVERMGKSVLENWSDMEATREMFSVW